MSKIVNLGVEKDHIESITRASGLNAIAELIWNSLDADAKNIQVEFNKSPLGNYEKISVTDDGHGLSYESAQDVFSKLGGSEKKIRTHSPNGRAYHGKEGKGRYKALALGDFVEFESTFKIDDEFHRFTIVIDRNDLSNSILNDPELIDAQSTGFKVMITNVNLINANQALHTDNRKELEEKFASYWIT